MTTTEAEVPTLNENGHNKSELTTNGITNIAASIFKSILETTNKSKDCNLIISPMLLEATLALLYLGSDGATAEQLQKLLQLNQRYANNSKMANYYAKHLTAAIGGNDSNCGGTNNELSSTTHIEFLSQILLPKDFEISDEFQKIAQKYFYTKTSTVPIEYNGKIFGTTTNINTIETPLANLFVGAKFHNKWFLPFSAYRTGLYDFYMQNVETSQQVVKPVAMLFDDDMFVKFGEFRELDSRAIELPYEWNSDGDDDAMDDELSMLLVLPNQHDGLELLEAKLCEKDLTSLTERMQMESVQVLLPKFKIDFECNLRQSLMQLGISTIFSKESNFKNLAKENSEKFLEFDNIIHKCSIEINESGSEAAKVLGALKPIVISNSLNNGKKSFRADHPFFFAIRSSDMVYFMGHVTCF